MNIALISYEFPPAVAIGGIGAYSWNAATMLADAGIRVAVFCAGEQASRTSLSPSLVVHRLTASHRQDFSAALVSTLLSAHQDTPFDVIEAPEIGPEGLPAFTALPNVARVVKLHTPSFLVNRIGWTPHPLLTRLRFSAASLLRGHWRTLSPPFYDRLTDPEYHGVLMADEIAAPSSAIARVLLAEWRLLPEKVHVFPLPFSPAKALLALPPPPEVRTIGFLGRLEPRKGILEIMRAMPAILNAAPHLRFRFIGPSWPHQGTDMRTSITRRYPDLCERIDFTGPVAPADLAAALARVDAVLLPSRWENFPFACWESLAAARIVIGSSAGGMAEVIQDGVNGLLVDPLDPASITRAVLRIAQDPSTASRIAIAGRARVTALLAPSRILPLQLASYERAIAGAAVRMKTASAALA